MDTSSPSLTHLHGQRIVLIRPQSSPQLETLQQPLHNHSQGGYHPHLRFLGAVFDVEMIEARECVSGGDGVVVLGEGEVREGGGEEDEGRESARVVCGAFGVREVGWR